MMERWRAVVGFEGSYEVSDQGRVRNVGRGRARVSGRVRTGVPQNYGHLGLQLFRKCRPTKTYVHRLVLEAFVGPCPEGMEACHFPDRDPANCRLDNLRWDTKKANCEDSKKHGTRAYGQSVGKLAPIDVERVRDLNRCGASYTQIGKHIGTCIANVHKIVHRKTWSAQA